MESILSTIDGTISSVTKLSSESLLFSQSCIDTTDTLSASFGKLTTDFSSAKSFIMDVEGDIDEETLKGRGFAIKDLEKAKKVWESVETLGRDF